MGGQIWGRRQLVMSNCRADWGFEIAINKGICVSGLIGSLCVEISDNVIIKECES